jgi:glutaminyl-tRNA synthetase
VGVTVSEEDLRAAVSEVVAANEGKLREQRYHCNLNILLGQVRAALKWADISLARAELDTQVVALLGPKTEEDLKPPEKKKKRVAH